MSSPLPSKGESMSELTKDHGTALRQYWLMILVIFLISGLTWVLFWWDLITTGAPIPEDIGSNPILGFIASQAITLFVTLTLALSHHLPLLLSLKPRPKRSRCFLVICVTMLIILEIYSVSPTVSVNCVTGEPLSQGAKFGLIQACSGQALPYWLSILVFCLIAILSFLCLLNMVQAGKGAVQSLINNRKSV
jgi:hypothetical protein